MSEENKSLMHSLLQEFSNLTKELEELELLSENNDYNEVRENRIDQINARLKELNTLINILVNRRLKDEK